MNNQDMIMTRSSEKTDPTNARKKWIENIQKWAILDKQLKTIHEQTKKIRESRSTITDEIFAYFHENKMNSNKIETNDGHLVLFERKDYSPLTYTYIEKCLCEIIPEKKQVDYILQYLKSKREIKNSPDIRKIDKK